MPTDARTITWIASYPKSGNTWARFLAANLLFGRVESAADLNRLVPDIHETDERALPPTQPTLIKTHLAFSPGMRWARHTAAAIYVARNPVDTMGSNFHYARRTGELRGDNPIDQFAAAFMANQGLVKWKRRGFGSWTEHVDSWLSREKDFPLLVLRYEEMLADATGAAKKICQFLKLSKSDTEIEQAAANSSFDAMRRIEESDIQQKRVGIFYKPYLRAQIESGLRFMRSGQSGQVIKELSPELRKRFIETFGPMMERLGYPAEIV